MTFCWAMIKSSVANIVVSHIACSKSIDKLNKPLIAIFALKSSSKYSLNYIKTLWYSCDKEPWLRFQIELSAWYLHEQEDKIQMFWRCCFMVKINRVILGRQRWERSHFTVRVFCHIRGPWHHREQGKSEWKEEVYCQLFITNCKPTLQQITIKPFLCWKFKSLLIHFAL